MCHRRNLIGEGGTHGEDDREEDDRDPVSEEYIHVKAMESSSSALIQLNRIKREKVLVEIISKQIQDAGACRMLVKVRVLHLLSLKNLAPSGIRIVRGSFFKSLRIYSSQAHSYFFEIYMFFPLIP